MPDRVRQYQPSLPAPQPLGQRILLLVLLQISVMACYAFTPADQPLIRNIFKHLHFLPIVLSSLWFGWRGGLCAALGAIPAYAVVSYYRGLTSDFTDSGAEALDLLVVALVAGFFGNRELARQRQLESAALELQRLNRELADSFEQVKRNVRLAAVGQLSAALAHELRNPLASVEGAAELLRQGSLPDDTRLEFFDIIRKEARRMSRLLNDLLQFARPRQPEFRTVSLPDLVQAVTRLVSVPAAKVDVEIHAECDPDLPPVLADPEQIQQVLLNLALNAVQAMESVPAPRTLLLSASRLQDSVRIDVRDSGPGIPADDLDRIFQPFFTTKAQGSGLGLPVAQEIVSRHGGSLDVRPNPERGTIFSFCLPVSLEAANQEVGS